VHANFSSLEARVFTRSSRRNRSGNGVAKRTAGTNQRSLRDCRKIAGIKLCQAYAREHNANFISVMPTNLYGPNDNFDLETSHVLAALLRKAHEAKTRKDRELIVWGLRRAAPRILAC
jgi:nucleoside-diphosphate-sugar epimerase